LQHSGPSSTAPRNSHNRLRPGHRLTRTGVGGCAPVQSSTLPRQAQLPAYRSMTIGPVAQAATRTDHREGRLWIVQGTAATRRSSPPCATGLVQTTRLSVTDRSAGTRDQLSVCKGCSRLSSKGMVSGYSPGPIVCGPHLEGVRH
jgi:hypothetical protein